MALHIDYYASLNSPWTHLGAARIEAMAMAQWRHDAHFSGRFRRHFRRVGRLAAAEAVAAASGLPACRNCAAGATFWASRSMSQPKFFPSSEALSGALRHRGARNPRR